MLYGFCGGAFVAASIAWGTLLGAALVGSFLLTLIVPMVWQALTSRQGFAVAATTASLLLMGLLWVAAFGWPPQGESLLLFALLAVVAAGTFVDWKRRRRRPMHTSPALRPKTQVLASVIGFALAAAFVAWLAHDERPERFPLLDVDRSPVPEAENGFAVLARLMRDYPISGEQLELMRQTLGECPEDPSAATPAWSDEARQLVQQWQPVLTGLDDVLERERFALPVPATYAQYTEELNRKDSWMEYCQGLSCLLSVEAALRVQESDLAGSLDVARRTLQLGSLICRGAGQMQDYLVGQILVAYAVRQVFYGASHPAAARPHLESCVELLEADDMLRDGFARAMAGEFRLRALELDAMARGQFGSDQSERDMARVLRRMPLVQVNRSLNAVGRGYERLVRSLDRYAQSPVEAKSAERTADGTVGTHGIADLLRNLIGSSVAEAYEFHLWDVRDRCYSVDLAELRLARVGLAVAAWHGDHGGPPGSLEDLVPDYLPALPEDPYTGKPFGYEAGDGYACARSPGRDGRFDGLSTRGSDDLAVCFVYANGTGTLKLVDVTSPM